VAKTEGGLTVHHSDECKEFSGALQPPCLHWGFSGCEIDPRDPAVPHRLLAGVSSPPLNRWLIIIGPAAALLLYFLLLDQGWIGAVVITTVCLVALD
jgi:hypothetical protein